MQISRSSSLFYDTLDSLADLNHNFTDQEFDKFLENGLDSPELRKVVTSMTEQLKNVYDFEESVQTIDNVQDFLIELKGFLYEMGCPYSLLQEKDMNERLNTPEKVITLLHYLTNELLAARISLSLQLKHQSSSTTKQEQHSTDAQVDECTKQISQLLQCSKSTTNDSMTTDSLPSSNQLFESIMDKIESIIQDTSEDTLGTPVILAPKLDADLVCKLNQINKTLCAEYYMRRKMLIKRADVTISSFHWSDRAKNNLDLIADIYQPLRHKISAIPQVTLCHLLAARDDISQLNKTSSGTARHSCDINQVVIGRVPDRGGRPEDVDAPVPDMPSWRKRQSGGNFHNRGRGFSNRGNRGGGGRGNFNNKRYNNNHGRGGFGGGYR